MSRVSPKTYQIDSISGQAIAQCLTDASSGGIAPMRLQYTIHHPMKTMESRWNLKNDKRFSIRGTVDCENRPVFNRFSTRSNASRDKILHDQRNRSAAELP